MDCSVYHRGGGVDLRFADERIKGRARSDRRGRGISSKYQCMDFSKGPKIAYIVLSILGIISGIYGYTIQDYTTVALGVLIFFLFLAEFFMANIQYKFYYSSTAFINRGKVVRYKSIKDFERKNADGVCRRHHLQRR